MASAKPRRRSPREARFAADAPVAPSADDAFQSTADSAPEPAANDDDENPCAGVLAAYRWAVDVTEGKIVHSRITVLACERFLRDLEEADEADSEFVFVPELAQRAMSFIELLPNIKGPKAGQTIELMPWQCFLLANLFGFVERNTGHRRFRQATIWLPKGNGKTALMAGVSLYVTFLDGEGGAEGYSAAVSKEQAALCFGSAREMVSRSLRMREVFGIDFHKNSVFSRQTASRLIALSSDARSLDGLNVHWAVCDEIGSHRTSAVYDALVTAIAKRSQPLIVTISTATSHGSGIGRELWRYGEQVLYRLVTDERWFTLIFAAPDDADPWSEQTWRIANPSLGITVNLETLRTLAQQAKNSPIREYAFRTRHLNQWAQASSALFSTAGWASVTRAAPWEEFKGKACWLGLDLSQKRDPSSWCAIFPWQDDEGRWHYALRSFNYLPRKEIDAPGNDLFVRFHREGWLTAHEGDEIRFGEIERDIIEFAKEHEVVAVGFDPWSAAQFAQNLASNPDVMLDMIAYRMSTRNLSAPTLELDAAISADRVHHDGNPMLSWCIGNVVGHMDANANVFPKREAERSKIDAAIAAIIAIGVHQASATSAAPFDRETMGIF